MYVLATLDLKRYDHKYWSCMRHHNADEVFIWICANAGLTTPMTGEVPVDNRIEGFVLEICHKTSSAS